MDRCRERDAEVAISQNPLLRAPTFSRRMEGVLSCHRVPLPGPSPPPQRPFKCELNPLPPEDVEV